MYKAGDLVFATVKGWDPWPGRVMCEVSPDLFKIYFYGTRQESLVESEFMFTQDNIDSFTIKYGHDEEWDYALEEMKNDPDIFLVSNDDACDHQCMTCNQRKIAKEKRDAVMSNLQRRIDDFNFGSELSPMKSVEVKMESIKSLLYGQESKQETIKNIETKRMSRKKITNKNRKKKGRLINQLYSLPPHFLKQRTAGVLAKMLKELQCSMCLKIFRNPIGLKIHLHEHHPEYQIETPKCVKKVKAVHETITIESDSSLADANELLLTSENESSCDDINDLLQSSDVSVNTEDLLQSSESDDIDDHSPLLQALDCNSDLVQSSDSDAEQESNAKVDFMLSAKNPCVVQCSNKTDTSKPVVPVVKNVVQHMTAACPNYKNKSASTGAIIDLT